jgi:outer membrane PBP1 activator LpoA protein
LLLQATTDNKLHGYTGALSLGPHNRIQREQTWAEFRDGNAVALPASLDQPLP